jgi:2-polyprenyl-3-methyl-5-hydroxy-6-metoxy-1,4-benzoquinol methylase
VVTPVDRDREQWALGAVSLHERDLNRLFADGLGDRPFDVVTSLEVIEHLENPSLFLRECSHLVSEAGFILLTTPNIENVAGRLRFLWTGHIRGFDRDERWNEPTHITPIQTYLFEKLYRQARLEEVWHGHSSSAETTRGQVKRLVLASLRPVLKGARGGEHHIYILRKQRT